MGSDLIVATGGCHCGAVAWSADLTKDIEAHECNCTLCGMMGFAHVIVPKSKFHMIKGEEKLSLYTYNTHAAKHYFCSVCGVKSFYVPRSNPDGYSLNLRCMDTSVFETVKVVPFDGLHWEENAHTLRHLSQE